MGLFDKFFSLFKKKKDKEPPTDEKEKSKFYFKCLPSMKL